MQLGCSSVAAVATMAVLGRCRPLARLSTDDMARACNDLAAEETAIVEVVISTHNYEIC